MFALTTGMKSVFAESQIQECLYASQSKVHLFQFGSDSCFIGDDSIGTVKLLGMQASVQSISGEFRHQSDSFKA